MHDPSTTSDHDLVQHAVDAAMRNVEQGGKPFACLIVRDGDVEVEAVNHVAQTGDPTAHAEIRAIREAAERGITDLTGYDVVVTAYPCPMCLGALYYAQPDRVLFAASREQEGEHYEDGNRLMTLATFYDEYRKEPAERALQAQQPPVDDPQAPFREWTRRHADD